MRAEGRTRPASWRTGQEKPQEPAGSPDGRGHEEAGCGVSTEGEWGGRRAPCFEYVVLRRGPEPRQRIMASQSSHAVSLLISFT